MQNGMIEIEAAIQQIPTVVEWSKSQYESMGGAIITNDALRVAFVT